MTVWSVERGINFSSSSRQQKTPTHPFSKLSLCIAQNDNKSWMDTLQCSKRTIRPFTILKTELKTVEAHQYGTEQESSLKEKSIIFHWKQGWNQKRDEIPSSRHTVTPVRLDYWLEHWFYSRRMASCSLQGSHESLILRPLLKQAGTYSDMSPQVWSQLGH